MPLTAEDTEVQPDGLGRLESLFRAHHDHLVRLGVVVTGDRALGDDLAQEAFIRLGRTARWPAEGAELAYLRRTVINLAHGHHRKKLVRERGRSLQVVSAPVDPAADAARADEQRRIVAAIRALPRRQMECVVLRFYAQLSDAEIAEVLEVSAGSIKTHLHRARAALAESLEGIR
jgi:RNA polymerase sigma factor (sigma-70 family)